MGISGAFMVPHPPLIIPDIGKGSEKAIQNTVDAYKAVGERIRRLQPEAIIVISPHQVMYEDYFHISPGSWAEGDFGQFGAGQVKIASDYDVEFTEELCRQSEARGLRAGILGERDRKLDHGTMVPLYFVNQYWSRYHLVRIGLSGFPLTRHYELGQCIQETAEILGRNAVVIGSGDLSHLLKEDGPYGYRKEGPEYDRRIMQVMEEGGFGKLFDFSEDFCQRAAECGHRSFTIMAGALDRMRVETVRLSYEGPFGVGYGVCAYKVTGWNPDRNFLEQYEETEKRRVLDARAREDGYVSLARKVIENYVRTGEIPEVPEGLPNELYNQRAGVFVSIKEDGRLRGCIGTIQPVCRSLAEEIIYNAVSACSRDPRFSPVERKELDRLIVSVDVLGMPEKIDLPEELDVKRYGVIVTSGSRRGLLLPDLEGVDTAEEQIAIARKKAGIEEWEEIELERFEVIRHDYQ